MVERRRCRDPQAFPAEGACQTLIVPQYESPTEERYVHVCVQCPFVSFKDEVADDHKKLPGHEVRTYENTYRRYHTPSRVVT